MLSAISSCWALLLGIALIMIGNGLQGTLLGLRATLEGFGTTVTGLVMTGYFLGFFAGSTIVPTLVSRVGHIRVFAALASIASGAVLLHSIFVEPVSWGIFRLVTGFCYAGLYIVAESWLNDAATNETRGQLLSIYMVTVLGGMGCGQFLLNTASPESFELFVLVSLMVSVSLVPISLTAGRAPNFDTPDRVSVAELYRLSPLGLVGALAIGTIHSSFFAMGAVYANAIGLSIDQLSVFIAAALFGGVLMQWPIGRLSDRFDRRIVITVVTVLAGVISLLPATMTELDYTSLVATIAIFGGLSLPLYSLCLAHTNDHITRGQNCRSQ